MKHKDDKYVYPTSIEVLLKSRRTKHNMPIIGIELMRDLCKRIVKLERELEKVKRLK